MKKIKKGKITYSQKSQPNTLTNKQENIANKVANEIVKIGYDANIKYDSGTIDIEIIIDLDAKIKGLNIGIFRVFWSHNGDNKLRYLGFGIGHFDGYEIKRGWTPAIEIKEVSSILKKDIEYYNAKKNFNN